MGHCVSIESRITDSMMGNNIITGRVFTVSQHEKKTNLHPIQDKWNFLFKKISCFFRGCVHLQFGKNVSIRIAGEG